MELNKQRFEAKTVEEAITNATVTLGITSDELGYDVIEKGSSGFLGINSKNAVIEVWKKADEEAIKAEESKLAESSAQKVEETVSEDVANTDNDAEESTENLVQTFDSDKKYDKKYVVDEKAADEAKVFLNDVFSAMNIDVTIETNVNDEDKVLEIELSGPEMGVIIGKRGATLDSLQYLTSLAVNRKVENHTRIKIDTEDYRARRKATLENLAKNTAYKAKRNKKSVSLEAMNPYERRIIHSALQDDKYVTTHSEGEEPYRHVVVVPKKDY